MSLIPAGTYTAKAGTYDFGRSSKGTEQVGVAFTITDGDYAGRRVAWYGFFNTSENSDRAIKSLRAAGWQGSDITNLDGLGSVDVEIVVEIDSYNDKESNKVAWVNSPGVAMKEKMTDVEKKSLAARLKGAILASRSQVVTPPAKPAAQNGATSPAGSPPKPGAQVEDEIPF